ncbi:MAG: DUF349 domain-containing protein, partial [Nocardioidaceae bacterium]|nr:DUF349 domain-containing protein [Nocardioidaceae bacterium]
MPQPEPGGEARDWGRVADDGTVYVRTAGGERAVGQWPGGDPADALALYVRRFDGLSVEVGLLERRVRTGAMAPDEAASTVTAVRQQVTVAAAVGDLAALVERLDALAPVIDQQRADRKAARAARIDEARGEKDAIVAEAERLANSDQWRAGVDRMRELMDRWKALPRLERSVDDALWRRFSTARTTYTRRRKLYWAEQHEQRLGAKQVKTRLVAEAQALASSTEWGPTSTKYRDLMRQWKSAGPAPRGEEQALWARFRTAQDTFFAARDAENAKTDAEYVANAEQKRAILADAESLVPVRDVSSARAALRDIADRWERAGKVPREQMRDLEGRLRAVEEAVRRAEDDRWRRSNPEARARAEAAVAQLEASLV